MSAVRSATRLALLAAALLGTGDAAAGPLAEELGHRHAPKFAERLQPSLPAASILEPGESGATLATGRESGGAAQGGSAFRLAHPLRPRPTAGTPAASRVRAAEDVRRGGVEAIRAAGHGLPTFHAGAPPPRS